jgi:hypothetical protein
MLRGFVAIVSYADIEQGAGLGCCWNTTVLMPTVPYKELFTVMFEKYKLFYNCRLNNHKTSGYIRKA